MLNYYYQKEPAKIRFTKQKRYNCRPWKIKSEADLVVRKCSVIHAVGNPKPWSLILGVNTSIAGLRDDGVNAVWMKAMWERELHRALIGDCGVRRGTRTQG